MADIDRIVQLNITRQTTVPSIASFSDILLVAPFLKASGDPSFDERVSSFGTLAEVSARFGTDHIVYKMAAKVFQQNPSVNKIWIGRKKTGDDGSETWAEALTEIKAENNEWYGICASTRIEGEQIIIADFAEANDKLYAIASADADIVDTAENPSAPVDIADYLKANALDRSFVLFHPNADGTGADNFGECAFIGKVFPKHPGSATWAHKTLGGVTPYNLTTAQINTATGKNANIYTSIAGIAITQFGTVGSGEYIDVIHGIDWLKARIQQFVFTPLVQQDKVPYTNAGIQAVIAQLKAALEEAITRQILASYEVTAPEIADIALDAKAGRILPDVHFTAIFAGAIHKVQIDGVVSL